VKGAYNPVPPTRSKELRDLIGRIFTLNWEKRPSINDILSTPVVKARITKFLSRTLQVRVRVRLRVRVRIRVSVRVRIRV